MRFLKRYKFASSIVTHGNVLDCACGSGVGSVVLNRNNINYLGVDLEKEAINFSRKLCWYENALFENKRGEKLDKEKYFDSIVSFETAEHTPDPEAFVHGLVRNLKDDGTMVISMPHESWMYHSAHEAPFHITNWNRSRFIGLLNNFFNEIELFAQEKFVLAENPLHRSGIFKADDVPEEKDEILLAVCKNPKEYKRKDRIVVNIDGPLSANIHASSILGPLHKNYHSHTLMVRSNHPEVFILNPHVDILGDKGLNIDESDNVLHIRAEKDVENTVNKFGFDEGKLNPQIVYVKDSWAIDNAY